MASNRAELGRAPSHRSHATGEPSGLAFLEDTGPGIPGFSGVRGVPGDREGAWTIPPIRDFRSSSACLELAPHSAQVGLSRRWTADSLKGWGLTAIEDSAVLVVSELVTNAITASAASSPAAGPRLPGVMLHLHYNGTMLRVEVWDESMGGLPEIRDSSGRDEGGRGLRVVSTLSERWGFRETARGKVVWCELCTNS